MTTPAPAVGLTVERLRTRLKNQRPQTISHPRARRAAVLVPVVATATGLALLCFVRSADSTAHRSEVAFPGGSVEIDDDDASSTALREAREELGIAPEDVELLGALDDEYVFVSNFVITPIVGFLTRPPTLTPDPREVERPILVPLADLTADGAERVERRVIRGEERDIAYFPVADAKMWGASARIVRALLRTWRA